MPINSFLYPGVKVTPVFEVANSLRFNRGSSDYLDKTFSSAGSRTTWTISVWVKRANEHGTNSYIIDSGAGNGTSLYFGSEQIEFWDYQSGSYTGRLTTNRVFRDMSAWYHIVAVWDTTNGTAGDRMRLYVNGVEETSFATDTNPSSSQNSILNDGSTSVTIGRQGSIYTNLYMAEFCYIDGQALTPTSFGEFDEDTGIWKPIDVSGLTFGTNGFYLDFENSSSLGADVSGNGNNFTVNNLTSIDQTTDTPTNNYCTMLGHTLGSYATMSEGGLKIVGNTGSDSGNSLSSFAFSSGKWYWEMKVSEDTSTVNYPHFVVFKTTDPKYGKQNLNGGDGNPTYLPTHILGMNMADGYYSGTSFTSGTTGTTGNGDIIQFFFDMDNGAFYAGRDGTLFNSGDPTSGASKTGALVTWTPDGREYAITSTNFNNSSIEFNFGNPTFSITSGNSDGNNYGNFEYDPQGYYALNSKNLAEYG